MNGPARSARPFGSAQSPLLSVLSPPGAIAGVVGNASASAGAHILIVEDDESTRTLLSTFLTKKGYRVTGVCGGEEALQRLESQDVDLVILDIMMPGISGIETLVRLRVQHSLPVIMASALADGSDVARALDEGADDYVSKPIDLRVLSARIEARLRRRPAVAAAIVRTTIEPVTGYVIDGRYELLERIGEGAFGVVWRARHRGLEIDVAIKLLRPIAGRGGTEVLSPMNSRGEAQPPSIEDEQRAKEDLRAEGVRAARVNHPNVVRVLDVGNLDDDMPFLVMELLRGQTVDRVLAEEGPLPLGRAVAILLPVLDALAMAHEQKVIHRDIKPHNVLMHRPPGGGTIVKVLDFGVAKLVEPTAADTQRRIVGSPAYMAPERLRGHRYDGRADVYSVGVTLYEMLTGKLPFRSDNGDVMAVALMHLREMPLPPSQLRPDLPPGVDEIVLRLLDKDPGRRPGALIAVEMVQDLLDYIG